MFEQSAKSDYELDEIGRPEQFRAFGNATRQRILGLLAERAATTGRGARTVQGSIAHHLKMLEGAGLREKER